MKTRKIYKLLSGLKIKVEINYLADGSPVAKYTVPDEVIKTINALIEDQEELEKRLDLILKSRLGKAVLGLAKSEDKEKKS